MKTNKQNDKTKDTNEYCNNEIKMLGCNNTGLLTMKNCKLNKQTNANNDSVFIWTLTMAAVVGAVLPNVFTLTQQMGACDVDNEQVINGLTRAGHMAQQVFQNRYDSAMRIMKDALDGALKRFSSLMVANGQIKLPPGTVSHIQGFIQYCRDEIRLGRDPQYQLYNRVDTHYYLDRMDRHEAFVKKSESVKKPKEFTADIEWEDWDTVFRRYLNRLVGRNGIPLSYIVREDDAPNPEPNPDFLQPLHLPRICGRCR